jgi:hypothetical protein
MTRTPRWAQSWTVVRAVAAALIAAAVIAQASRTIGGMVDAGGDVFTTVVNFFSFFTILSNVLSVVALGWAAIWFWTRGRSREIPEPRSLAVALACATSYMIVTGIVYNVLLRGIPLPQGTTVPWANEVLHVVGPIVLLADLFLGPRRRPLPWRAIAEVLVLPVVWVVYTLVRGPLTTNPNTGEPYWYPYPFLNPNSFAQGYATVAVYVVGIAIVIALAAWLVVWVGRRRGMAAVGDAAEDRAAALI